jgi:hypothetical protein
MKTKFRNKPNSKAIFGKSTLMKTRRTAETKAATKEANFWKTKEAKLRKRMEKKAAAKRTKNRERAAATTVPGSWLLRRRDESNHDPRRTEVTRAAAKGMTAATE